MRALRTVLVVAILTASIASVGAYSPIFSIGTWDADQLAKAGISITLWKHESIGEDPPAEWVKVTYDSSTLHEDLEVLMTLSASVPGVGVVCTCRTQRLKGGPGNLTLLFAVREKGQGSSHVEILMPELMARAVKRPYGNPGFAGYTLPVKRILELAREATPDKASDKGAE